MRTRPWQRPEPGSRSGFTLIELLTVMAIMGLLMGATVAGWIGIRRGAEMRGAVSTVRSNLAYARQRSITHRERVWVCFTNANSFILTNRFGQVGDVNYLPPGVEFAGNQPAIVFWPDGNAGGAGTYDVTLREVAGVVRQKAKITVYGLTGLSTVDIYAE